MTVDYGCWKIGSSFHLLARGAPVRGRLIAAAMLIMEDLNEPLDFDAPERCTKVSCGRGIDAARGQEVNAAILCSYKLVNFLYDGKLYRKPAHP